MIKAILENMESNKNHHGHANNHNSMLFTTIKTRLNINFIVDKMIDSIMKDKEVINVENITSFVNVCKDYFKNGNDIISYLVNNDSNSLCYNIKNIVPFAEYDSMEECIILKEDVSYNNDEIKTHINSIFKDNVEYLDEFLKVTLNCNPIEVINRLYELKDYMITMELYLYSIINGRLNITKFTKTTAMYIDSAVERLFNKMLLKEARSITRNANILDIKSLHSKSISKIDERFVSLISMLNTKLNELADSYIAEIEDQKSMIMDKHDDSSFVTTSTDGIAIIKTFHSSTINEDLESEKFIQPGNKYSKDELIDFMNLAIKSINFSKEAWSRLINQMNLNLQRKNENISIFDDEKVYLFILDKQVTEEELGSYAIDTKEEPEVKAPLTKNPFISLLDYTGASYEVDKDISFNINDVKDYNENYLTLNKDLLSLLSAKIKTIDDKELFTLSTIKSLSEKHDELINMEVIPLSLDYFKGYLLAMNNNNGEVMVFKPDNLSSFKTINKSLFDFIKDR